MLEGTYSEKEDSKRRTVLSGAFVEQGLVDHYLSPSFIALEESS